MHSQQNVKTDFYVNCGIVSGRANRHRPQFRLSAPRPGHGDTMNLSVRSAPPWPVTGLNPHAPSHPNQTQGTLCTWLPNAILISSPLFLYAQGTGLNSQF